MKCPKCHLENTADSAFCRKCGTRYDSPDQASFTKTLETTSDGLARGTLFAGRYEIIEELGAGGMGRVYRAHDTKLNEEVALKLIKPEIAADKRTVERFRNEIKNARKISHPNVCRTHDLGEEGKTLYLTMEYIRGEDLKSLIHRMKVLAVGSAVSVGRQIAEGLAEAHKQGIVHRDLKPGNVMIDKDGQAKIMDFGIARSLVGGGITGEGAIIGTPEYMSPEQVEGKPADPRADIYALGIILFEMVTGRVPFEGETAFSIANKHRSEPAPDPRILNPQIPDGLSRVILHCLEKEKGSRYQTTDELLSDLEAIEASLPTTERAAGRAPSRTRPKASRDITVKFTMKRWLVPAAAFAVLAGAFSLWWFVFRPKPAPSSITSSVPTIAILNFENLSRDESLDLWREGIPDLLITGLSQSRFVNVLPTERIYGVLKGLELSEAKKYTAEELAKIATLARASHLVTGSYIGTGGNILITLTVLDPKTGHIFKRINAECKPDLKEICAKVDDLSFQVRQKLDLSPEQLAQDAEVYKKVEEVTTSSPEAMKYYNEASRLSSSMKYQQAIAYYERALELDPGFAMAYRRISAIYGNMGNQAQSWKYLRKALALREHLTELERLQIEAQPYVKEQNYAKAIEILEKLVKLYPAHWPAYQNLGMIYPDLDKRIEFTEKAVQLQRTAQIVRNLAGLYMEKGLYQKAEDLCRSFLKDVEENAYVRSDLALSYSCRRQFDAAYAEAEKICLLNKGNPAWTWFLGDILLYKGDLAGAAKIYHQLFQADPGGGWSGLAVLALLRGEISDALRLAQQNLKDAGGNQGDQAKAYMDLAGSLEKAGRFGEAFSAFDQYLRLSEQSRRTADEIGLPYLPRQQKEDLFFKGRIQAEMNKVEAARKTAEELKSLIDKGIDKSDLRYYEFLLGLVELTQKDYRKAVGYFESAAGRLYFEGRSYSDDALYLDVLARSLYEAGDLGTARREYEKITMLTSGRYNHGDIYAKAFYRLGKIAEQQRDKARAIVNFGKFLDLWKDADPGIPEVEDAKKRLGGLTGS